MKKYLILIVFFLVFQLCHAQTPSFIKDSLETYIEKGMKNFNIPGLAIAIIKDGKTVIMKGYGTRELGKNEPVDENTLFMIASNSKLFTGTALAKLNFEKKLSLNDKVTKHLPDFKLYDDCTTQLVNIKDLLSHRIGFKTFQSDFLNWDSNLSRSEVIYSMRKVKPTQNFRQDYGYCNSCFATAGEIIPRVTGLKWEDYVKQNILDPLRMTNTFMLTEGYSSRNNIAKPHTDSFVGMKKIQFDKIDNIAPAGSMVSCVKDISKWLQMQLDSGKFEGKRVLDWNILKETRIGNTITRSIKSSVYPTHYAMYGLGVFSTEYAGRQVYHHTGGAYGFVTNTCFIPEENLGITILTNNDNQNFFEILRYQIMDAYLGLPYKNRSIDEFKNRLKGLEEEKATLEAYQKRVDLNTKFPLDEAAFIGEYSNDLYGKMWISREKDNILNKLVAKFEHHPDLVGTLDLMSDNEFRITYSHQGYGIFPAKFEIKDKKVRNIEIKVSDFVEYDSYIFSKKE